MVSPELLRRYPFFAGLNSDQLANIAMSTDRVEYETGSTLFSQGDQAEILYFLLDGCVDLYYTIQDAFSPGERQEAMVCQINPGEIFGISALIPPHELSSTARCSAACRIMAVDGKSLAVLFENDPELEIILMRRVAQAAMQRLYATRVQLAAAYMA